MQTTKQIMQVTNFSGINQAVPHTLIEDNQAVFMGNMQIDSGVLKKRYGINKIYGNVPTFDVEVINIVQDKNFIWILTMGDGTKIKIVRFDFSDNLSTKEYMINEDYDGNKSRILSFNDNVYVFTHYKIYKFENESFVVTNPYIPTVLTTCSTDGSGRYLEDMNLLNSECYIEYSIPKELPSDLLMPSSVFIKDTNGNKIFPYYKSVSLNGINLEWEKDYIDNGYQSNRPTKIIFTEDGKTKLTQGTNNVKVHANFGFNVNTKTIFNSRFEKISKCRIYTNYGGDNDNRMLLSGNPDMKNCVFRSGVLDLTYFPENAFQLIGDSGEAITGFQKQYDCCIVLKENTIWRMEFNITSAGVVSYHTKPLNDNVGCNIRNCVNSMENNTVFLNKDMGLYRLFQSNQRGEANVGCISQTINNIKLNGFPLSSMSDLPDLANYNGLINSINSEYTTPSMVNDGEKLYISSNSLIYVYNYKIKAWYIWNVGRDISKMFCVNNKVIFFSGKSMFVLKKEEDYPLTDKNNSINLYVDTIDQTNETIKSIWISKQYDFSVNERKKTVDRMFIEMQSLPRNSVDVYSINKDNQLTLISEKINDLFGYNRLSYNRYGYNITPFPREVVIKYKAKKIGYFQLILVNDLPYCASNIQSFDIRYKHNNYYK